MSISGRIIRRNWQEPEFECQDEERADEISADDLW
jgi:hypothetical protein